MMFEEFALYLSLSNLSLFLHYSIKSMLNIVNIINFIAVVMNHVLWVFLSENYYCSIHDIVCEDWGSRDPQ